MTTTTIEEVQHLTSDEQTCIRCTAGTRFENLDQAEAEIRGWFGNWFVYRGGNHVALHRSKDDDRRILLVVG